MHWCVKFKGLKENPASKIKPRQVLQKPWSGAGTLSFTVNPPTTFNLIAQTDLPAATAVHIAIYFANNLSNPIAIRGDLAGGSGPSFSLVATGYKFANANQAFTPDQFNSMQGTGASLVLPLAISDLVPGDLIYAVAVSRNTAGALSGGFSAPADPNVQVRTSAPAPSICWYRTRSCCRPTLDHRHSMLPRPRLVRPLPGSSSVCACAWPHKAVLLEYLLAQSIALADGPGTQCRFRPPGPIGPAPCWARTPRNISSCRWQPSSEARRNQTLSAVRRGKICGTVGWPFL